MGAEGGRRISSVHTLDVWQIGAGNQGPSREELEAVEARIRRERAQWQAGLEVINRLTNFKKTPVVEKSREYYQCLEASKVINQVEAGAPALKATKARLEAEIRAMDKP